jgi:adenosylhomocysteine nucleosidase
VSQRKWLILTALAMEANEIASELGGIDIIRDVPAGLGVPALALHVAGIRAVRINRDLLGLFDSILLAGLGGALDPSLKIGDIVVDSTDPASDLPSPGFRGGKIHTSDHLISDVAEKERLFRETGSIAVDMEGSSVRALAESAGIPFLHVRAVSDTSGDVIPARMMKWVDDVGEPRMSKVTADLAFHPQLIPAMIRLGNNSRIAARKLAQAVRQIVRDKG